MEYRNGLRKHSNILIRLLHLADSFCALLCLWILVNMFGKEWSIYWSSLGVASVLISFIVFYSSSLYRPWRGVHLYKELAVIVRAWLVCAGLVLLLLFVSKTSYHFSRRIILTWLCVTPFVIFVMHMIARLGLRKLREMGFNLRQAIIVGANRIGIEFARYLYSLPWTGIKVLGFFDDRLEKGSPVLDGFSVLGSTSELTKFLKERPVDYVYVALPLDRKDTPLELLDKARTCGAQVFLVPDVFCLSMLSAQFVSLGDIPLVSFNPDFRWKRHFDIVFSLVALMLSMPLFMIIGLLIKLQDGGPIFYGHRRITATGKEFVCWKFRTMVIDADKKLKEILASDPAALAEWLKRYKLKNDPRITRLGKFLRKTSLDELPQFFNVLKGDMSVVGARPVVPRELSDYYKESAGLYCSIKPGITGPWQVGKRNDTDDYDERVKQDVWYIQNCSLWLDVKIIAKTILRILRPRGAY